MPHHSDRQIQGIIVTLDNDYSVDAVQPLLKAIEQLRGVASAHPKPANQEDFMARQRVRSEMGRAMCSLYNTLGVTED